MLCMVLGFYCTSLSNYLSSSYKLTWHNCCVADCVMLLFLFTQFLRASILLLKLRDTDDKQIDINDRMLLLL